MEHIDIYDADLRPLGTEERLKAHLDGHWHKTFHFWVVSPGEGGRVLYQYRSPQMNNFPDMLDVSAAGHLLAGEQMEQGIREAEEELGITVNPNQIHSLGYRVEVADQTNGQRNREYQKVHIALLDIDLNELNPQIEEVSGLYWVPINGGVELFLRHIEQLECSGIVYDSELKKWSNTTRLFTLKNFLPRIQQYYLTMHIMAERLIEGKKPLSIS